MTNWTDHESTMKQAVTSTLENITFSIVEDLPKDHSGDGLDGIRTSLIVTIGDEKFIAHLTLPQQYLESIISTLYPDVDSSYSQYQSDTIDELANTIFGSFFRSLESEIGVFSLSIPDQSIPAGASVLCSYAFLIDDHFPIQITISQ